MKSRSFLKSLFFGVIPAERVVPYPRLEDAERRVVQGLLDELRGLRPPGGAELVVGDVLPALGRLGVLGLRVPKARGGLGLSHSAAARVLQEIGSLDASLGVLAWVHNACGVGAVLQYGTDVQQERLLPALARGEGLAAFALAEGTGSDAAAVRVTARFDAARSRWVLSGVKPWVTGADRASLLVVFARTTEIDEGRKPRLACFLVERSAGFRLGAARPTAGLRGVAVHEVDLEGVELTPDALLGEVGKGYPVALGVLDAARPLFAALLVGQARALVTLSVGRLTTRHVGGRTIGGYAMLQDKLTRMVADAYAVESLTFLTTGLADRGVTDLHLEAMVCRLASSEALLRIATEAAQIAASDAFLLGSAVERHLRDVRGWFVIDGTNETFRSALALAGMRGPAARAQDVSQALEEPLKGLGVLRELWARRVQEKVAPERLLGISRLLSREVRAFELGVEDFARSVDRLVHDHGGEIAEMQYAQMRVANTAIDLYAMAACIARASRVVAERGEAGARRKLDVTRMFVAAAERRVRANLAGLGRNDDELRRAIATRTFADGGYPFDVL